MPSEKPWTSSSALPRNWILTKIMPPDCLAWQPGGVFVCGGFDGYGMTRRNVVYLPIYSRFQSTCHIRGMTCVCVLLSRTLVFQSTCHIRGMTFFCPAGLVQPLISIHMPHTWHDGKTRRVEEMPEISIHMPHTWHDDVRTLREGADFFISIHMPHTWHDAVLRSILWSALYFNPHATYVA